MNVVAECRTIFNTNIIRFGSPTNKAANKQI